MYESLPPSRKKQWADDFINAATTPIGTRGLYCWSAVEYIRDYNIVAAIPSNLQLYSVYELMHGREDYVPMFKPRRHKEITFQLSTVFDPGEDGYFCEILINNGKESKKLRTTTYCDQRTALNVGKRMLKDYL